MKSTPQALSSLGQISFLSKKPWNPLWTASDHLRQTLSCLLSLNLASIVPRFSIS
jgi:hypothetical protein